MSRKTLVMFGMVVGSVIGGYIPVLFGVSLFSMTSILGNAAGGLVGIWLSYKLTSGLD